MGIVMVVAGGTLIVVGFILSLAGVFDPQVSINCLWAGLTVLVSGLGLVYPGTVITIKNWFYDKNAEIDEARADISVMERKQDDLKERLADLLEKYISHEQGLIEAVKERGVDKLIAFFEKYPELKASQNISILMEQLVILRDGIAEEEITYNKRVREYNSWTAQIPQRSFRPEELPQTIDYK